MSAALRGLLGSDIPSCTLLPTETSDLVECSTTLIQCLCPYLCIYLVHALPRRNRNRNNTWKVKAAM